MPRTKSRAAGKGIISTKRLMVAAIIVNLLLITIFSVQRAQYKATFKPVEAENDGSEPTP